MSATTLLLEDSLEDNPQSRNLLNLFEQDAAQLKEFTKSIHENATRIMRSHSDIANSIHNLSVLAKAYQNGRFPLETNDSILGVTLSQFGTTLEELSSWHQIQAQQLQDSMVAPLNNFLKTDMEELSSLQGMTRLSEDEMEAALSKHSKLSKRDSEKKKLETNQEVFHMRHKYHQTMMHYIISLNTLQLKRKFALIEPFMGFIQSSKDLYKLGIENLLTNDELDGFCENISTSVQNVHTELADETNKLSDTAQFLEQQCLPLYYAETPKEMSHINANHNMNQKAAYLNVRFREAKSRLGLTTYRWDRVYVFIQAGNLLMQRKGEVVATLLMEIDKSVSIQPVEVDDRRFVFQVSAGSEEAKTVYLMQAENGRHVDEWMSTISNVVNNGSGPKPDIGKLQLEEFERHSAGEDGEAAAPNVEESSYTSLKDEILSAKKEAKADLVEDGANVESQRSDSPPTEPTSTFTPTKTPIQFDFSSSPIEEPGSEDILLSHPMRFMGSMLVGEDRGEKLVQETIRQIMASRAIHNVFRSPECHLNITTRHLDLIDEESSTTEGRKSIMAHFDLSNIAFWMAHKENDRLFAFISRTGTAVAAATVAAEGGDAPEFRCHVFESSASASQVGEILSEATKAAYEEYLASMQ